MVDVLEDAIDYDAAQTYAVAVLGVMRQSGARCINDLEDDRQEWLTEYRYKLWPLAAELDQLLAQAGRCETHKERLHAWKEVAGEMTLEMRATFAAIMGAEHHAEKIRAGDPPGPTYDEVLAVLEREDFARWAQGLDSEA